MEVQEREVGTCVIYFWNFYVVKLVFTESDRFLPWKTTERKRKREEFLCTSYSFWRSTVFDVGTICVTSNFLSTFTDSEWSRSLRQEGDDTKCVPLIAPRVYDRDVDGGPRYGRESQDMKHVTQTFANPGRLVHKTRNPKIFY